MTRRLFDFGHSDELEDRIVGALRREGLIQAKRPVRTGAALAVILTALLAAVWLYPGRDPAPADGRLYVLALYSPPGFAEGGAGRAAEYGRWARAQRSGTAAVVGGEELGPAIAALGPTLDRSDPIGGYFIVRAESDARAVALARSSPHLTYGGTIVVHPVRR